VLSGAFFWAVHIQSAAKRVVFPFIRSVQPSVRREHGRKTQVVIAIPMIYSEEWWVAFDVFFLGGEMQ
jgi:hypothetical protein